MQTTASTAGRHQGSLPQFAGPGLLGTLFSGLSHRFATGAWLLPALLVTATADEVTLDGGRRVTGSVSAVLTDGTTTLETAFAKSPLTLRGEMVRTINLTPPADPTPAKNPHALILRNNDVVPCEITAMDADKVTFHSAALGELSAPRDVIRAIRFGLRSSHSVLAPPQSYKNWAASEVWKGTDDSLISSGDGHTSLAGLKLPNRFILRFRLEWQGMPNFLFHFADNHLETSGQADRYFLTFNQAGLEIKRQCSNGRPYFSLASIPKPPDSFTSPGNTTGFDLEIRVDRPGRSLQLAINGELQGTYRDSAETPPNGNGLMLFSRASGPNHNILRNLEISEWSPDTDNPAANLPEPADTDSISVHNAPDTMSGVAQSIRLDNGKPAVVFQSPHAEKPLVVTNAALLTLHKPAQDKPGDGPLSIGLAANGKLTARTCTVDAAVIAVEHPLLGSLKLNRGAIRSISRATPPPATPRKKP